jgi:hypothetical protein
MLFPVPNLIQASIVAFLFVALAPVCSADDDKEEVARELGAVLAWRLGPEAVEQACRGIHPEGIEARSKAVRAWLAKNAELIAAVDARVAEVVPLAFSPPPGVDAVVAVTAQVRRIVLEPMLENRNREESRKICEAEAGADNPRWTNSGVREVQMSLAALYDFKMRRAREPGGGP